MSKSPLRQLLIALFACMYMLDHNVYSIKKDATVNTSTLRTSRHVGFFRYRRFYDDHFKHFPLGLEGCCFTQSNFKSLPNSVPLGFLIELV